MLLFLDEQDVARHSRSNMDNDSTDNEEMEGESPAGTQSTTPSPTQANAQMFEEEQSQATQSQAPLQSTEQPISNSATQSTSTGRTSFKRKRSKTTENEKITTEVLQTVQNHLKKPTATNDRFDIFGANVAAKLRDLTKHQRILAEKIINETLFHAEMENLTMSHQVIDSNNIGSTRNYANNFPLPVSHTPNYCNTSPSVTNSSPVPSAISDEYQNPQDSAASYLTQFNIQNL
ncbi:uncharacterized protein [Diabrotica undecimpunctata]|uniref:uncharacterized protein n=1 Tax=Diabrotica undecimpunctata TaxID=50387 RepID=UPI003B637C94